MIEGSWAVQYEDGRVLAQFDVDAPEFFHSAGHPRGGEVPLRTIDWRRVTQLTLESDWVTTTLDVHDPGPEYEIRLVSRTFMLPLLGQDLRCFLVCTMRTDVPVDLARVSTLAAATVHVLYWMPDGSTHECPHYDCPDIGRWVQDQVRGRPSGLSRATHTLPVSTSVELTA